MMDRSWWIFFYRDTWHYGIWSAVTGRLLNNIRHDSKRLQKHHPFAISYKRFGYYKLESFMRQLVFGTYNMRPGICKK